MEMIILLDNIRSAQNVGAIFRTADGAGAARLYLGGYTPAPIDRFGRVQPAIVKTSLGAASTVPWESVTDQAALDLVSTYRERSFKVVAIEQTAGAVSLYDFTPPERVLYIFGNEVDGVRPELCEAADTVVEIPMLGKKESLNVSVAAGIVLFHRG